MTDDEIETQQSENQSPPGAALTIVIHSWATPIVGVVMLVIGLLGGYFGRPLLAPQSSASAASSQSAVASTPDVSAGAQNQSANPGELMAAVVAQTRHFKGDPEAPVTLIEFSDFQ